MVEIFEHWVIQILSIPAKVLDKFYQKKNLSPKDILDTDVKGFIGDDQTKKQLNTLNNKYQQWQLKKQQKRKQ